MLPLRQYVGKAHTYKGDKLKALAKLNIRDFLHQFAIRSVEVRRDLGGDWMVVYWSPVVREYWSCENLTELDAANMAEVIRTRLAFEQGAPNISN